jgi:hypothetical protein
MAENYMMVVGCIYGGYCSKWYFAVRENRIVVEFVLYSSCETSSSSSSLIVCLFLVSRCGYRFFVRRDMWYV